jgi:hypothetical protein
MKKPRLKQFCELVPEDFERSPVWIACHVVDYGESWYGETDEETVRAWGGALPVDPSTAMLLVRAKAALRDGTEYPAFLTPDLMHDMGTIQPHLFVFGEMFGFWGGMLGVKRTVRDAFYRGVSKPPSEVFPITLTASPRVIQAGYTVEVRGFYRTPDLKAIEVET